MNYRSICTPFLPSPIPFHHECVYFQSRLHTHTACVGLQSEERGKTAIQCSLASLTSTAVHIRHQVSSGKAARHDSPRWHALITTSLIYDVDYRGGELVMHQARTSLANSENKPDLTQATRASSGPNRMLHSFTGARNHKARLTACISCKLLRSAFSLNPLAEGLCEGNFFTFPVVHHYARETFQTCRS